MPRFDAKRAEKHLASLRKKYDIKRHWIKRWDRSFALMAPRSIRAPKVKEPIDYLVNLHEMGHIVSSTSRRYQRFGSTDLHAEVMREASAWAWAVMEADPIIVATLTNKDWHKVSDCLITYFRAAAGEDVQLVLPEDAVD